MPQHHQAELNTSDYKGSSHREDDKSQEREAIVSVGDTISVELLTKRKKCPLLLT
jgi:hypothetical protein